MKNSDIVYALAQKVVDTIYADWKHDGHIEIEHADDFWFTLDGRLYKVTIEDVDCEGAQPKRMKVVNDEQ